MADVKSVFDTLSKINVNDKTEKKNGLTYLSWAWAWGEVKKRYPDADYRILRFGENQMPFQYDERLGIMCWTTVTICGETKEMWLPVMDGANKTMLFHPYEYLAKNTRFQYAKLDKDTGKYFDKYGKEQTEYIKKTCEAATMFDINKTIMRCLVKNLAVFGLGLYIYAGNDLPEEERAPKEPPKSSQKQDDTFDKWFSSEAVICPVCGGEIEGEQTSQRNWTPGEILSRYGMCKGCYLEAKKNESKA